MKPETDPITDDEWLLRRVRRERFRNEKVPMISPGAFEVRVKGSEPDTDGISMYRLACLSAPEDILAGVSEDKKSAIGIVKIPVSLLKSLGLSVQPCKDERVVGHIQIPELNVANFLSKSLDFTKINLALAGEASRAENIVLYPTDPVTV